MLIKIAIAYFIYCPHPIDENRRYRLERIVQATSLSILMQRWDDDPDWLGSPGRAAEPRGVVSADAVISDRSPEASQCQLFGSFITAVDRSSVVVGKRVLGRLDLGGGRVRTIKIRYQQESSTIHHKKK